MFRDRYQAGFLNLFHSAGSKPLGMWESHVENGYIKRITDPDIRACVVEVVSTMLGGTYVTCPKQAQEELAIKLPFLVLMLKYLKKYFTFEVQVLDDMNTRRCFRGVNYQSKTRIKPFLCILPMRLDQGWNQVQLNLNDLTRRAYGTTYVETVRVTVFANCRLRRIYFSDRLCGEDDVPPEYRLTPSRAEVQEE